MHYSEPANHFVCRATNSRMINSSISTSPFLPSCSCSNFNHVSVYSSTSGRSVSMTGGVCTPVRRLSPFPFNGAAVLRSTNTTSCFRRCRSLPTTSWWPYLESAARDLGMRRFSSVSSLGQRVQERTYFEADYVSLGDPFLHQRSEHLWHLIHFQGEHSHTGLYLVFRLSSVLDKLGLTTRSSGRKKSDTAAAK